MPRKYTKYLDGNAEWDDPKKVKARNETIISSYRREYGEKLEPGQQYWTMCGAYFNSLGVLDGEFGQIFRAGLILPEQFIGVDQNPEIINRNKIEFPHLRWICSDFLSAMEEAAIENTFNPAIVNYDSTCETPKASLYLKKLLSFLSFNSRQVMVVANVALNNAYRHSARKADGEHFIQELLRHGVAKEWRLHPEFYEYKGSGKRAVTWMASFLLFKG